MLFAATPITNLNINLKLHKKRKRKKDRKKEQKQAKNDSLQMTMARGINTIILTENKGIDRHFLNIGGEIEKVVQLRGGRMYFPLFFS
jgi:hypothetical protein